MRTKPTPRGPLESAHSFDSRGALLAATATIVPDAPAAPIVVHQQGSGPIDRDGNAVGVKLNVHADLAALLAEHGLHSLRVDKPGTGRSEGDHLSTGLHDEYEDARAAVAYARTLTDGPVYALGHSAGGLHAARLAANGEVAGAMLLACPGGTGEEVLRWQTEQIAEHSVGAFAKWLLRVFRTSPAKQQAAAIAKLKQTTTDVARIQGQKTNAKWMREMLAFSPLTDITSATVPILAITGTKDTQVNHEDLAAMRLAGDHVTAIAADGVDHILRDEPAPHSRLQHYRKQIRKPISALVTTPLLEWCAAHAR